jgi:hypothetical protein
LDDTLVEGDDGLVNDVLEDGVAVGEEIREVDIPDGVDVDKGRVEGEGGVSRLEGTGMGEVNDGTGELKEPDMLSILDAEGRSGDDERGETWTHVKKEEYWVYGLPSTGLREVKVT